MVQLLVDALACLDPDGLGPRVLPAAECLVYLSCFSSVIVSVSKRCARLLVGAVLAPFFSEPDDISEVGIAEHSTGLEKSCSFVFVARRSLHPGTNTKFCHARGGSGTS